MIKSYKNLIGYQKGYGLFLEINKVTKDYPQNEMFGLVSQMRRSAVSIPRASQMVIVEKILKNIFDSPMLPKDRVANYKH